MTRIEILKSALKDQIGRFDSEFTENTNGFIAA